MALSKLPKRLRGEGLKKIKKLDKLEAYGRYSPKITEFARGKIGSEKE